jgi:hypothetical protein
VYILVLKSCAILIYSECYFIPLSMVFGAVLVWLMWRGPCCDGVLSKVDMTIMVVIVFMVVLVVVINDMFSIAG